MKEALQNFPKGHNIWILVFVAIILALAIRIILSYFKALAYKKGEIKIDNKNQTIGQYFKQSFLSCSGKYQIDDHFIPLFIGIFELIITPYFLEHSQFKALAAWFGFKAIGTWATRNSRTAYNRFLLGNILSITGSFILWKLFY